MVTKAETRRRPPLYRAWQFIQALLARQLNPAEWQEVSSLLTSPQQRLFGRMETSDQRHSLQVLRTLVDRGESCHDLLVAGLLHDVGKSRHPLRLWERPIVVLIRLFRSSTVVHWGQAPSDNVRGWKRPFVVYEHHAAWGAQMAAAAGCSSLTVWLIRRHQGHPGLGEDTLLGQPAEPPEDDGSPCHDHTGPGLLRALLRADSEN